MKKRSSCKILGIILVDRNSGGVHFDIVSDYSSQETIKSLRRFASLCGWPVKLFSDPGSQLVSSSGVLETWVKSMGGQLSSFVTSTGFEWEVSPESSPWRQRKCEVHITFLKRLNTAAIVSARLTPSEIQTVFFEAVNLCNECPIDVHRVPRADGTLRY